MVSLRARRHIGVFVALSSVCLLSFLWSIVLWFAACLFLSHKLRPSSIDLLHCSDPVRAAACHCIRAIDLSSPANYRSLLALTSTAYTRSGQSERCIPPAPIRTPEWSSRLRRIIFIQPRGTPEYERLSQHGLEGCIFPNTFPRLAYPSMAIVPFVFRGLRHGLGVVHRTDFTPSNARA